MGIQSSINSAIGSAHQAAVANRIFAEGETESIIGRAEKFQENLEKVIDDTTQKLSERQKLATERSQTPKDESGKFRPMTTFERYSASKYRKAAKTLEENLEGLATAKEETRQRFEQVKENFRLAAKGPIINRMRANHAFNKGLKEEKVKLEKKSADIEKAIGEIDNDFEVLESERGR